MIVIHATEMSHLHEAIARLCDPVAKVSAHYVIDQAGTILSLVADEYCAWHAGESYWQGVSALNHNSLGIELDNLDEPFCEVQLKALEELLAHLTAKYDIRAERVLGHADIAPWRRKDPGELFPWERFQQKGWGLQLPVETSRALVTAYGHKDKMALSHILTSLGYVEGEVLSWQGLVGIQALRAQPLTT